MFNHALVNLYYDSVIRIYVIRATLMEYLQSFESYAGLPSASKKFMVSVEIQPNHHHLDVRYFHITHDHENLELVQKNPELYYTSVLTLPKIRANQWSRISAESQGMSVPF